MIKQIGLPLRSRLILLITRMITDRFGLHSVLLPLDISLSGSGRGRGGGGRLFDAGQLLSFFAFRMGAYSR